MKKWNFRREVEEIALNRASRGQKKSPDALGGASLGKNENSPCKVISHE